MFVTTYDAVTGGAWVLQSREHGLRGMDVSEREFMAGVRVDRRDAYPRGFGEFQIHDQSVGDVHGGTLWEVNPNPLQGNSARSIPMWRFSTPCVIVKPDPRAGRPEPDCEVIDQLFYQPIGDVVPNVAAAGPNAVFHPDDRLERDQYKNPSCDQMRNAPLWNDLPANWVGISLTSNLESEQQRLFLPTDPRLITPSHGSPLFTTRVVDVQGFEASTVCNGVPDGAMRMAGLDSLCRVVAGPVTRADDCAALNPEGQFLVLTGIRNACNRADAGGMGFWPATVNARKMTIGMWPNTQFEGPFTPGEFAPEADKHYLGKDVDDNAINSLHIHTTAFFYQNDVNDAPLDFGSDFEGCTRGDKRCCVELQYDGNRTHFFCGNERPGIWRWVAYCEEDSTTPPSHPPTSGGWPPWSAWIPGPFSWFAQDFTPFNPYYPLYTVPSADPLTEGGGAAVVADQNKLAQLTRGFVREPTKEEVKSVSQTLFVPLVSDRKPGSRDVFLWHEERAAVGILARPQFCSEKAIDARNFLRGKPDALTESLKSMTPITARLEAIGYQDVSNVWTYHTKPGTRRGRYSTGEATGGFLFTPANLALEDYMLGLYDSTVTHPYASLVFAPDFSMLKFGTPDVTNAELISYGYSWHYDSVNKDLVLRHWNGTAYTERLRFDQSQTRWEITSGDLYVPDSVIVDGDVTIATDLDVDGATTLDGLTVAEAATFNSTVNVQGAADLDSTLNVDGESTFNEIVKIDNTIEFVDGGMLTIAAGTVSATHSDHSVKGEGSSGTDDLDWIYANDTGHKELLILKLDSSSTQNVQLRDGMGNLNLAGSFTLTSQHDRIFLQWDTDSSVWNEITRSNNA